MNRAKIICLEISRIILGLTFVVSALLKAIDPTGVSIKISQYLASIGMSTNFWGGSYISLLGAIALCSLEFIVGSFTLIGIYRRQTTRILFILMLAMTCITCYTYFLNPIEDCGCFGDAVKLTHGETLLKNLILLPLSYLLMRGARRIQHLYKRHERWIPETATLFAIGQLLWIGYRHLPILDFRPYKIGYNLTERIEEEEKKQLDRISKSTYYIYNKDGNEQKFYLENLPDSSWTYVRTISEPNSEQTQLTYDFHIYDQQGTEYTNEILQDSIGTFLLLSPEWQNANQGAIEQYNELYQEVRKQGFQFYALSSVSAKQNEQWRYLSGAEYPIFTLDKTTIKTIIRSNPGLVIMKKGVILNKVSIYDLPKGKEIPNFVSEQVKQVASTRSILEPWGLWIWLTVTLWGIVRLLLRNLRIRWFQN